MRLSDIFNGGVPSFTNPAPVGQVEEESPFNRFLREHRERQAAQAAQAPRLPNMQDVLNSESDSSETISAGVKFGLVPEQVTDINRQLLAEQNARRSAKIQERELAIRQQNADAHRRQIELGNAAYELKLAQMLQPAPVEYDVSIDSASGIPVRTGSDGTITLLRDQQLPREQKSNVKTYFDSKRGVVISFDPATGNSTATQAVAPLPAPARAPSRPNIITLDDGSKGIYDNATGTIRRIPGGEAAAQPAFEPTPQILAPFIDAAQREATGSLLALLGGRGFSNNKEDLVGLGVLDIIPDRDGKQITVINPAGAEAFFHSVAQEDPELRAAGARVINKLYEDVATAGERARTAHRNASIRSNLTGLPDLPLGQQVGLSDPPPPREELVVSPLGGSEQVQFLEAGVDALPGDIVKEWVPQATPAPIQFVPPHPSSLPQNILFR